MIRVSNPNDREHILAITNEVIMNTNAIYREEPHTLESRKPYFEEKERLNIPIFVYEENGRVLGFVTYGSFRDNPGYRYTVEHSLHVSVDARGRGIGEALLNHLIESLRNTEIRSIVGVIDSENTASCHLHEKCGFILSGTLHSVAVKKNQWLDACFYQYLYL